MSRTLAILHESEAIEELLVVSQQSAQQSGSLCLIRRRRSIDLLRIEPSLHRLHTLPLTASHLISLRNNLWLAVCTESSQLALISLHQSRQLRNLNNLTVNLPSDWPRAGESTIVVQICQPTPESFLFAMFMTGIASVPVRFSVQLTADGRALSECTFFSHADNATSMAVFDAAMLDDSQCLALLHTPRRGTDAASNHALDLSLFEVKDKTTVQQWTLGRSLWVALRVSPRLVTPLGDAFAVFSLGSLIRFDSRGPVNRGATACPGAKPPVAFCVVNPQLLCLVAKSGELGVVAGSEYVAIDCSDLHWPFDPPHSVAATQVGRRVTAVIASRCNARLVMFDMPDGAVKMVVDGALPTRLPIADALFVGASRADIAMLGGGGDSASMLQRVSLGAQLVVESRGDADLGVAKLLSARAFLGQSHVSVVAVTSGAASTSQMFVLDASGVPTAHEVAIDEANATLALVSCDTMIAVQAIALQVTCDAVNDIDTSGWVPLWQRPSDMPRVDLVACCGTFVALGCGATLLLCRMFDVLDEPFQVLARRTMEHAIAAMALTVARAESRPLVAVSQWTALDVQLLECNELKTVSSVAKPLGERATSMCWFEKAAAGSGEQFGARADLLLVVGCGDGALHLYPVDGLRLVDEHMCVSVGVSAVSLLSLRDDATAATASSVLALCASGTLTASSAMLLHVEQPSGGIGVLHVVNADAVRSACALDATPRSLAWLSAADGALVVGQLKAPMDGAAKRWTETQLAGDAIAIGSMANGTQVVALFETSLALFSVDAFSSVELARVELLPDSSGVGMATLANAAVVVYARRLANDALLLFEVRDSGIASVRDMSLDRFGTMCRLAPTLVAVALAYPPRIIVVNSELSVIASHPFAGSGSDYQFNELLPVDDDGLVCALSHVGARLVRVRSSGVVLDIALQMASIVRYCATALLDKRVMVAFDYDGGATFFDIEATGAVTPFRHDDFEVPLVDALPYKHFEKRMSGTDRVLQCWREEQLSVCLRSYLAPHTARIDEENEVAMLLLTSSGELQVRAFDRLKR